VQRLHPTFLLQDYQQLIADTNDAARYAKEEGRPNPPPPTREKLDSFVVRIRDTVAKLPQANRNTLQYLISHLTRLAGKEVFRVTLELDFVSLEIYVGAEDNVCTLRCTETEIETR